MTEVMVIYLSWATLFYPYISAMARKKIKCRIESYLDPGSPGVALFIGRVLYYRRAETGTLAETVFVIGYSI